MQRVRAGFADFPQRVRSTEAAAAALRRAQGDSTDMQRAGRRAVGQLRRLVLTVSSGASAPSGRRGHRGKTRSPPLRRNRKGTPLGCAGIEHAGDDLFGTLFECPNECTRIGRSSVHKVSHGDEEGLRKRKQCACNCSMLVHRVTAPQLMHRCVDAKRMGTARLLTQCQRR